MKWETVEAFGTVAGAMVAIIAIWQQNRAFKATLAADLSMKLDDRFGSEEFRKTRSKAARSLRDHVSEGGAEDVFDFFEMLGLFARRKVLDVEIIHSFFFHWISLYWIAGRDHIVKKQLRASSAWKDFGDLYLSVLRIEQRISPSSEDISPSSERITSYLNDEMALYEAETEPR